MERSKSQLLAVALFLTPVVVYAALRRGLSTSRHGRQNESNSIGQESKGDDSSTSSRKAIILYGSTSGTASKFATTLSKNLSKVSSLPVKPVNLQDYDEESLSSEDIVLILVSTMTEGRPPASAERFVAWLKDMVVDFRVSKNHLSKVKFSVFGLGGSVYSEHFCTPAKEIQACMQDLGAQEIAPITLGDDASNLENKFVKWKQAIVSYIKEEEPSMILAPIVSEKKFSAKKDANGSNKSKGDSCNDQQSCECTTSASSSAACGATDKKDDSDEEEEEDRINNQFVNMDSDDEDANEKEKTLFHGIEDNGGEPVMVMSGSKGVVDLEDLAKITSSNQSSANGATAPREMVTKLQRKALNKEGYKIIGSHSAVKLCRWTKNQMRGRGGCYKHSFYGITSYQCMEATPSLACANKCVFCWRHHKNPVGTEWRWKTDEPEHIVKEAISLHQGMIREMKGVPGVLPERLQEGLTVRHCALSLVGEPIMYPRINDMLRELHIRDISSFLVTNAQFPERIQQLDPVTQLYVSIDAASKDSLKAIDRPLFKDFWERYLSSLEEIKKKEQRTVFRLTLVKAWNMNELDEYCQLIEIGEPDFIEIKAVTYCGKSDASSLTMQNVPWHAEVCNFAEALAAHISSRNVSKIRYSIATEHEHSCCILLAREDKFLIDGAWYTWIDYPKFSQLIREYYESGGSKTFTSLDYAARTPEWAWYKSNTRGFDPEEQRWRRNKAGVLVENTYEATESGCG